MIRRLIILLLIVGCGTEPEDCAGVEGGTAELDCFGVCGGVAIMDDCGLCTGGTTGLIANSFKDCAGVCGGNTTQEVCDECNSGIFDCEGICGGDAVEDCAGVCNGTAVEDCAGGCGGSSVVDECGVCGGNNMPNTGTCDCASTPNGTATIDNCGVCDGDNTNNCTIDCFGVWGGDAECPVADELLGYWEVFNFAALDDTNYTSLTGMSIWLFNDDGKIYSKYVTHRADYSDHAEMYGWSVSNNNLTINGFYIDDGEYLMEVEDWEIDQDTLLINFTAYNLNGTLSVTLIKSNFEVQNEGTCYLYACYGEYKEVSDLSGTGLSFSISPNPFSEYIHITLSSENVGYQRQSVYIVDSNYEVVKVFESIETNENTYIWHGENDDGSQVETGFYKVLTTFGGQQDPNNSGFCEAECYANLHFLPETNSSNP